jgi:hypothetical protein
MAAETTTLTATSVGALSGVQTNENLQCYVQRAGYAGDEFYGPGSCGTLVAVDGTMYGFRAQPYTYIASGTTGTGTASDPEVLTTQVALGDTGVVVTQIDRVVHGSDGFTTEVSVLNQSGSRKAITVYRTGDCYVAGSDVGYGALTSSGGVACQNADRSISLTWTPITPDNVSRVEDHYGTNYSLVAGLQALPGTCLCNSAVDNGMSLRWAAEVENGGTARFSSRLDLGLYDSGPGTTMDSDRDGLPDSWELGNARDESGNPTYDLKALGAKPDHADLFLAIDAERDAPLSKAAEAALTQAFSRAPVSNPDGSTGIAVHFAYGPGLSFAQSDALQASGGGPDWRKVWDRWLSWAPHGPSVYHYVLQVAWKNFAGGQGTLPGQMIITNNCGARSTSRTTCKSDTATQAGTLMHEMGHNLGLRHGGGDDLNYKPNYPSVMNYLWQNTGVPGVGLDYSHWGSESFYPLDEGRLVERDGILLKPGATVPSGMTSAFYCAGSKQAKTVRLNVAIDWSCRKGIETGYVRANINAATGHENADGSVSYTEDIEVLEPHDDWSNIHLTSNHDSIGFGLVEYRVGEVEY